MNGKAAGFGKSMITGAVVGVIIVVVGVAVLLVYPGLVRRQPVDASHFVLVVAGPGEDGVTGARIIVDIDATTDPARLATRDPSANATIEGTSYERLSDAYAFGGGAGVVHAAYKKRLPYVSLEQPAFNELVKGAGGIRVDIPEDVEVFTGEELLSFRKGWATLGGTEAVWLLEGAAYLRQEDRQTLTADVARQTVRVVSLARGGVSGIVSRGEADSDVPSEALPSRTLP